MTTFQAIIYGITQGFSFFLPISASAHRMFVPYLLNWPEPTNALLAAIYLGGAVALLVYFIHDWASIISSFLQVILFRRKPMTLDERLPIFLLFTGIPLILAYFYLVPMIERVDWSPGLVAIVLAAGGLPLLFTERGSRKNKGMFDWNWVDAFLLGIGGIFMFIPGGGQLAGFVPAALVRNYNREAAVKYSFFAMFPIFAICAYVHLHKMAHIGPGPELSWLSFGTAAVVSFVFSLLAIGGLTKHVLRNGFGQYVIYRFLLAAAVGGMIWVRNR